MNDEKVRKLKSQQVFKNYRVLCEYLEEEVKTGAARIKQTQIWSQYCTYDKQGHKIIITRVKPIRILSDEVIPDMTEQELIERYGTKEQKERYRDSLEDKNRRNSIKKTVKEANRYADIKYNKKTKKYEVEKVYKYPVPKKMVYMRKEPYRSILIELLNNFINNKTMSKKEIIATVKQHSSDYLHYHGNIKKYLKLILDIEYNNKYATVFSSDEFLKELIMYLN